MSSKPIIISFVLVIALITTCGCFDNLATPGDACGLKTSVVHTERAFSFGGLFSMANVYVVDYDGVTYVPPESMKYVYEIEAYSKHNITFSYYSYEGKMRIKEIIADHTEEERLKETYCVQCCPTPTPTPIQCETVCCRCV